MNPNLKIMNKNFKYFILVFTFSFVFTCLIIYQTKQYDPRHNLLIKYLVDTKIDDLIFNSGVKQKNVFIDLGANKGDSLMNFLNLSAKAQGGSLNIPNVSADKQQWIIYLFEANERFSNVLNTLKQDVEKIGHIVHLHDKTAAWIYDGTIDFYLDTINTKNDFWGSSLMNNHVSFLIIYGYFLYIC